MLCAPRSVRTGSLQGLVLEEVSLGLEKVPLRAPPRSLPPHQGECQALGPATMATLFPPLTLPGLPSVPGGSGQPDPKPLPAQTACFHEGQ